MVELASLHTKITGDSTSLVTASNTALAGFAKLGLATKRLETSAARSSVATVRQTAAFRRVAASTKLAAAATTSHNAVLRAFGSAAATSQAAQTSLNAALNTSRGAFTGAGTQVVKLGSQIKTSRFHTANLTAQFNDIGVMLNSGQSPFTLAIQQGTQITQVLQTMGGTAREQVGALITAFRAMISPTAIAVVGIIALGVVLARYGLKSLGAADNTDELKDAISALDDISSDAGGALDILTLDTKELADKFGEAGLRARELSRDIALLTQAQLTQELKKNFALLGDAIGPTFGRGLSGGMEVAIRKGMLRIKGAVRVSGFLDPITKSFTTIASGTGTFEEQQGAIETLINTYDKFGVSMEDLPSNVLDIIKQSRDHAISALEAARAIQLALAIPPEAAVTPARDKEGEKETKELERLAERIRKEAEMNARANEEEFLLIQESFFNKLEAEEQFHDDRLSIITAFGLEREENEAQAEALREREVQRHNDAIAKIEHQVGQERLRAAAGVMGGIEAILAQSGDKMFRVAKVFGAARALINAWIAFSEVLADPTLSWWERIPLALVTLAAGLAAVNAIKGASKGGSGATSTGAASSANAGSVAAPETSNTTSVNIALRGQVFDRGAVIGLIEQINEAVGDGARIRTV